ncbi:MAG: hypothetical protein B7X93_08570 [Hydrogenophilales bacterium 17-61-9]|nr:MAG: hypothetical protein B7X93_08570 [Hydrogenophilales bacterium 17-61-9]
MDAGQIEIECADPVWLVAEWPDGTWCDLHELREMTHMSDDYQIMRVLTHDEGYTPIKTQRWSQIAND